MSKVHITLVKEPYGVTQWLWINSTHQGALREVACWLGTRLKEKLEDERKTLEWHVLRAKQTPCNAHLTSQVEACQKFIDSILVVQQLLAQEKLEDAVEAYNRMDDEYSVEMGEDPIGA